MLRTVGRAALSPPRISQCDRPLHPALPGCIFYTAKISGQMFDIFLAIHRAPCYNGCIEKREKDFPIYHTGGYFNGYEKTA